MIDIITVTSKRINAFTYTLFSHPDEPIRWNVDHAKEMVKAGRVITRTTLDKFAQSEIAANNDWDEAHIANVDPTQPGIAAPIIIPGVGLIYVLIDGTHRCVRALRDGVTFSADLLTDDAARECVLEAPKGVIP